MYKLINDNIVLRIIDNTFIPTVEGNIDYQAYLAWIAEGNTVLPADVPT